MAIIPLGPSTAPATEQTKRAGVAEDRVVEFVMDSAESKFYPASTGRSSGSRLRRSRNSAAPSEILTQVNATDEPVFF
jgi:hypothetical protein